MTPNTIGSAPAPDVDPLAGTAYRTRRRIGAGAMGQVFEAEHLGLHRSVAVKLLTPALARDPAFVDRLRLEAQALASVRHPNVVLVHDHATTPTGVPFLVMELLEGRTLHALLRERGSVPLAETVRILDQVCAGLAAIHEAGLTHRDLKPANIFLCEDNGQSVVKLLDFGIVKLTPRPANAQVAPLLFPTATGHVLGTPRCMAPEQILGTGCDARTDIYAVGVLLYMLMAGRDPFHDHRTDLDVLTAHVTLAPPPLSKVASQPISTALDALAARALAKEPGARFASMTELRAALQACLVAPIHAVGRSSNVTEKITPSMFARSPRTPAPVATAPIEAAVFRPTGDVLPFVARSAHTPSTVPPSTAPTPMRLPPSFGLPAEASPAVKMEAAPLRPSDAATGEKRHPDGAHGTPARPTASAMTSGLKSPGAWLRDPRWIFGLVGVIWCLLAVVVWRIL